MPARPGNITNVTSSEGLATLNQQIREIHIRIDQTNKQIPVHRIYKSQPVLNFGSIPANSAIERTVALSGATQQGAVHASPQLTLGNTALIIASAHVSSNGQVTVRVYNPTAGPITPNTVKWNLAVVQ